MRKKLLMKKLLIILALLALTLSAALLCGCGDIASQLTEGEEDPAAVEPEDGETAGEGEGEGEEA